MDSPLTSAASSPSSPLSSISSSSQNSPLPPARVIAIKCENPTLKANTKRAATTPAKSAVTVTERVVFRKARDNSTASRVVKKEEPSETLLHEIAVSAPNKRKKKDEDDLHPSGHVQRVLKRGRSHPTQRALKSEHGNYSLPSTSRSCSRPDTPDLVTSRSGSSHPSSADSDCKSANYQRDWSCREELTSDATAAYSAAEVVERLRTMYKPYFRNPQDPNDVRFGPDSNPEAFLEYPNNNAVERYILLAPKDKDHYNPIMCLESSLYIIIEHYLTEKQRSFFGPIPTAILCDADTPPSSGSPSPEPQSKPGVKKALASKPSKKGEDRGYQLLVKKLKEIDRSPPKTSYLRSLQRAINTFDGPLFLHTLEVINSYLRFLKYPPMPPNHKLSPNYLKDAVNGFTVGGLPKELLMRILEENYQRSVGPNVPALRKYEAFSSKVYGELMPSLAYQIIADAGLKEDSVFVDLGSGVANVVVQASLQTGCYSFGVEIMNSAAEVAAASIKNFEKRCRMWGLNVGKMETELNDMMASSRLDALIPKADLLLVDNKVFAESLNEALRPKFLDLKEGAIVVSLAPFVSTTNGRVNERNLDDITAIFDVTEKRYHSGSVSWGNGGGTYYVHRVNRAGYAKSREQYERLRDSGALAGRATRSRRSQTRGTLGT